MNPVPSNILQWNQVGFSALYPERTRRHPVLSLCM